jgi:hypothetical protein
VRSTAIPNGFEGRTSTGYRFFERLYVDGLRARFAADANWRHGDWRVIGEVLQDVEIVIRRKPPSRKTGRISVVAA